MRLNASKTVNWNDPAAHAGVTTDKVFIGPDPFGLGGVQVAVGEAATPPSRQVLRDLFAARRGKTQLQLVVAIVNGSTTHLFGPDPQAQPIELPTGMGRRPVALLPYMIALAASGYALLAFLPGGMARHLLSGLIYGAGYGMVHTLLIMNIFATTPPERTGAAVGALFFAFDAATALGAMGLGWIMEQFDFRWGWAIGAALMTLSIPVARRIVRRSQAVTTGSEPSAILGT